jgi:hypothetical protein
MDAATLPEVDILAPGGGRYTLHEFGKQAVPLGKGGAGSVYRHPLLPKHAIKIYHDQRRAEAHREKVRAMLHRPPRAVRTAGQIVQLAWPEGEVVLQGQFIGLAMPLIDFSQAWKLQQAVDPPKRRRHRIPERLEFRLYAARNLVAVLHSLHEAGHYVIDLKPQNVLVYRDQLADAAAHIILVDCDGFQIRGPDGRRHDADLATPEFLHPEVARQHQGDPSFDKRKINDNAAKQDNFALAVILFQLLNDGLHPMAGRPISQEVPSDLASRLQKCGLYYPYRSGGNGFLQPDQDSLHRWFDPALRALFDRAFSGQGEPPPQREWLAVLDRLVHPDQRCPADPDHWKLGSQCGLCERAAPAVRQTAAPARAPASMPPPAHAAVNVPPAGTAFASPPAPVQARPSVQPALPMRMGRRGGRGRRLIFGVLLLAAMLGIGWVQTPRLLWQVRHRLESLAAAPSSPAPAEVRQLQAELAALGYYHGPADGVAGALTIQAATAFAQAHGLALSAPLGEAQLRQVLELAGAKAAPPAIVPLAVPLTAWADRAVAVRTTAGGAAAIIGTIKPGQAVTIIGRLTNKPWLLIATSEGRGFAPAAAFAAAVPAAPAAAAAAKAAPAVLAGVPEIIDTGHLLVDGRSIALQGIEGLGGRPAQELAVFIRNRGGKITCRFLRQGYGCRTVTGNIDIGLAALLNGAATAAADASPAQRQAQQQAQAAHRGMWK